MKIALLFSFAVLTVGRLAQSAARADPPTTDADKVRALVKDLGDKRLKVREQADRALRGMGKEIVPLLKKELEASKSEQTRPRLKRIIDDWARDDRVLGLIQKLASPRFRDRQEATEQLVREGEAALPILKRELARTPDAEIQRRLESIIQKIAP